jgi:hypothetical protein
LSLWAGAIAAAAGIGPFFALEPDGDELKITLKGDLAGMLNAARERKR